MFKPTAAPKVAPWSEKSLAGAWLSELQDLEREQQPAADRVTPMTQYATDPAGFLCDVLGIDRLTLAWSLNVEYRTHEWDGTHDPLVAALEAVARGQWLAVSSGTSTGKTFLVAALILWHCAAYRDSITVTVATKEDQMAKGIWREVGRLWPKFQAAFPLAELTTLRIRMDPDRGDAWGAWAITAKVGADEQSATSVQGLHAARLLILCDEMPGIPQPIVTALVNTATDEGNVIAVFGNPDNQSDPLAVFGRQSGVLSIRISALDHPNVVTGRTLVPGAVSRQSIIKRAEDYGVDSPLYGSRVQGIAPAQASDALVHRAWIEQAQTRGAAWLASKAVALYPVAYGVDPSNSDAGDEAAIARFQGPLCTGIVAKRCPDANVLGREVFALAQSDAVDARHVGVDSIGVGAGTVNESRRLYDYTAAFQGLNGGAGAISRAAKGAEGAGWEADANQFLNLRAQMYWQLREDLRKGVIGLPADPQLLEELILPRYEIRNGKVVVEPKADIKLRLGRSPNRADAVVYANWVRPRTLPAPQLPPDAANKNLGVMVGVDGKRRVKRVEDVVKHPGRPRAEQDNPKWWDSWGRV